MSKNILFAIALLFLIGCSSPKKREEQVLKEQSVSTVLKSEESLGRDNSIGVNKDGKVIHMNKVQMAEYLQNLKYETFKEYEALYGIREYSSKGLAGKVDTCEFKTSQKKFGGDGNPPKLVDRSDILNTELMNEWKNFNKDKKSSDTNATIEVGYSEKGQVTALTSENLLETIERFQDYRKSLNKKRVELEQLLTNCEYKIESAKTKK